MKFHGLLSKVDNKIEKEIYIDKISEEYGISKEAIYAQTNKLSYANNLGSKALDKNIVINRKPKEIDAPEVITKEVLQRENTVIYLLINNEAAYDRFKENITTNDFKSKENKIILQKLYDEYKKGNSNIKEAIELFEDEKMINHLTGILMEDYTNTDIDKGIDDILSTYKKEKLVQEKNSIVKTLENKELEQSKIIELESRLTQIIMEMAKMK